jgi:hypothetical protein
MAEWRKECQMKRRLFALSVVVALGIGLAVTLSASVSSLTVDAHGTLAASKISVTSTGTIVCTSGDSVDVTVVILQTSGKVQVAATGDTTVSCNGDVQAWAVVSDVVVGSNLKAGPAIVLAQTFDSTDSSQGQIVTQRIQLQHQ